jgi:peptide/nickel transport system permease protein
VRLLPGNPAVVLLGPLRTAGGVARLSHQLGLDKPLDEQYWVYLQHVLAGNFGRSFYTGNSVGHDLVTRVPATLELLFCAMLVAVTSGLVIGVTAALRNNRGWFVRGTTAYGRLAGAFPDFWVGLVAIYIFFFRLRWFPAPLGRLSIAATPPPHISGFYTIDSILAGNLTLLGDAVAHLALPVMVLGLIVTPIVAKTVNAAVTDSLQSEYVRYARACGIRRSVLVRYVLRNSAAPVITITGVLFVYLLGGDVLIEKVFSWSGVGLYAVQGVVNDDYFAVQGFVLIATLFTVGVFLIVDLLHLVIDPRVEL